MNEKEHVLQVYKLMYKAMVEKDTAMLNRLHSDDFVLIHITGMRQSKAEYINSISNGTLNRWQHRSWQYEDSGRLYQRHYRCRPV